MNTLELSLLSTLFQKDLLLSLPREYTYVIKFIFINLSFVYDFRAFLHRVLLAGSLFKCCSLNHGTPHARPVQMREK